MSGNRLAGLSKLMSLILRHEPDRFGVTLDAEGYAPMSELLAAIRTRNPSVSEADVREVVERIEPDKKRFTIQGGEIRANYGHSLDGKVRHVSVEPPSVLFHGTSTSTLPAIRLDGLRPMTRQYVHLTSNRDLARRVGARHGVSCVLEIDAARAWRDGVKFYRANEAFWLVDALAAEYLREL